MVFINPLYSSHCLLERYFALLLLFSKDNVAPLYCMDLTLIVLCCGVGMHRLEARQR
jgi:hypothetical protein